MPRRNKRKNKPTPSPSSKQSITKKIKQVGVSELESQSESEYCDAEEQLAELNDLNESLPHLLNTQSSHSSQSSQSSAHSILTEQPQSSMSQAADTTMSDPMCGVVCVSTSGPVTAANCQPQEPLDDSIIQSQSILQAGFPSQGVLHTSTPLQSVPMMPPMAQMSMPLHPSQMLPPAQTQIPVMTNVLSENDVLRVAMKVKAIMVEEIETLVTLKVNEATAQLKHDVDFLKDENSKLKADIKKLENTCKSNIDDLEQYSRRSCLRISGIKEEEGENTDEIVLDLARRVSADIRPEDVDRSHRVGRPREVNQNTNAVPRPREIIVKLANYRARMQLLKGRAFLRSTKARIFINEDLTSARKEIAYECRGLKRDNKIKKMWTYNGNIFIKDNNDIKKQISSVSELDVYKH